MPVATGLEEFVGRTIEEPLMIGRDEVIGILEVELRGLLDGIGKPDPVGSTIELFDGILDEVYPAVPVGSTVELQ